MKKLGNEFGWVITAAGAMYVMFIVFMLLFPNLFIREAIGEDGYSVAVEARKTRAYLLEIPTLDAIMFLVSISLPGIVMIALGRLIGRMCSFILRTVVV